MATGYVKGEWQKSTQRRSETPQPIDTKFETGDYVRETTPVQNFVQIQPLEASRQMGEI